jgi:type 1 fimbria pilin
MERIMNILKWKNYLKAFALVVLTASSVAQAATLTFSGLIYATTCSITMSQTAGSTTAATSLGLTMPSLTTSALSTVGAITASKTSFYMGVTGCTNSGTATVTPKLYLASTSASGGYLSSGITNLVFEMFDSTNSSLTLSTTATAYTKTSFSYTGTPASYYENQFYVQYRTTAAVTATGSPSASITVTLLYA